MSKRIKIVIAVVVAALLITAGGAATVLAQDEPQPEETEGGPLAAVAEILGISQEELAAALKQAGQELVGEIFTRTLEAIHEKGVISDDEAAAIRDWWAQRPEPSDANSMKAWLEQRPEISEPAALHHLLKTMSQFGGHPRAILGRPQVLGALATRAAAILDIPPEDLVNAFRQVFEEAQLGPHLRARLRWAFAGKMWRMSEQALAERLAEAVQAGKITGEQAEKIRQHWMQTRQQLRHRLHGLALRRLPHITEDALSGLLTRAIDEGRITQQEAEQIRQWWQQRPEALSHLLPPPPED